MQTLFIVNPNAGRRKAARIWQTIEEEVRQTFPEAQVAYTQGPSQAKELALAHKDKQLVVVGGDGSFHEALQGAMQGTRQMGIIPAGSGNDLVRALGRGTDPRQALADIRSGKKKTIDLGQMEGEYFVNGAGIGYDAKVTFDVNKPGGFLSGQGRYLFGVLKNLFFYKGKELKITADNFSYQGKVLCLTLGNGPYLGGGIPLVPDAVLDDGLLSATLIEEIGLLKRLTYVRKVLIGQHKGQSFVKMFDTRTCQIEGKEELIYHQDGEVFYGQKMSAQVLPQALTLLG